MKKQQCTPQTRSTSTSLERTLDPSAPKSPVLNMSTSSLSPTDSRDIAQVEALLDVLRSLLEEFQEKHALVLAARKEREGERRPPVERAREAAAWEIHETIKQLREVVVAKIQDIDSSWRHRW